jgi:hypothetical protein
MEVALGKGRKFLADILVTPILSNVEDLCLPFSGARSTGKIFITSKEAL